MLKLLLISLEFFRTYGQFVGAPPGGAADQHGCVLDGGYSWCDLHKDGIRPWEEDCVTWLKQIFVLILIFKCVAWHVLVQYVLLDNVRLYW